MKTYAPLAEHGVHPDDNRVKIPAGWNVVMYCDDPDEEAEPVKVDSLPKPGQLIVGVFNLYAEDFYDWYFKKKACEEQGYVFNPEYTVLLEYIGLDRNNYPLMYPIVEKSGTLFAHKEVRVFKPVTKAMVAWLPFPELPSLPK